MLQVKKKIQFNQINFANLISKSSNTQVITIKDYLEIAKFLRKNLISNEIIIGMGAGSISKWMGEIKNTL